MKKGGYEGIAREILTLNELNLAYVPSFITLQNAKNISNEFYKRFFNHKRDKKIDDLDEKITYKRNNSMKDYNGLCSKGTEKSLIILPSYDNAKLAVTATHEKAHAYQKNDYRNEVIPSFFDVLFSVYSEQNNPGILNNNLDYKIKEAKKAASLYMNLCKSYDDEELIAKINYMFQFTESIRLVNAYLNKNKKIEITELLDGVLFGNLKVSYLYPVIYSDKSSNIKEVIKTLRNT